MSIVKFNGATMTSDDLLALINEARAESGEPQIRRNKLAEKIEDELAGEHYTKRVVQNLNSTESAVFDLTRDQCMLVSMRESKAVRRRVVVKLNALASQAAFPIPQTRAEAMRLAADLEEKNELLALVNQQQAAKIESLENFFMAGETPFQFVKRLNGVNCSLISHALMEMGWVFNDADPKGRPHYRVYSSTRAKNWLNEKPRTIRGEGESTFVRYDLVLLLNGAKKLHDLYMSQKLPMKKTWDGRFSYIKFTPETSL
ncbi:hypothetical protein EC919_104352 [Pseudomonas graminis]|uniref:phage antirepressor protein n=1 Tax=Pseudomonas graminis TaxID=158627 RepID=UPI00105B2F85|nr:phage antirepressor protein [Pseudomonas graminis]TDV54613.1 hypothetical protein EC919_104352 [Pseudomonas graminis]